MKKALALRHVAFEDLGCLAPMLASAGYAVDYFDVGVDSFTGMSPLEADIVVVLGGPIAVYDTDKYPYLGTEIAWLRARVIEDLPTLGICLGAQVMAAALNARVYPGTKGPEIGWSALEPAVHTGDLAAFGELLKADVRMLHWHGDTFDLPQGARHLAATGRYANQAFLWGENCLALQFHPEFDSASVEKWLIGHAHEIAHTPDISLFELRADAERHGPAAQIAAEKFWSAWLRTLQSGSGPAKSGRVPRLSTSNKPTTCS